MCVEMLFRKITGQILELINRKLQISTGEWFTKSMFS